MPDTPPQQPVPPIKLLGDLWHHLTRRRKQQLIALAVLMVLSALAEVLSLGAIIPFLAAISEPEKTLQQPLVSAIAPYLGITSGATLVLPLACAFGLAVCISAAIRALQLWVNTRISYAIGGDLSVACYRNALYQPYEVQISRNSSAVLSTIAKKIGVTISVLYQAIGLVSSIVVAMVLTLALAWIDPRITLLAGGVFGIFYLLISRKVKEVLLANSIWVAQRENYSFQILQEGLGGARDVLLDSAQEPYANEYGRIVHSMRIKQAQNVFLASSPRYLMEALGMCLMVIIAYYLVSTAHHQSMTSALPMLGAFALGAQRLLPTLQQIYAAWAGIAGNYGGVNDVLELLNQKIEPAKNGLSRPFCPRTIELKQTITLQRISYRYPNTATYVLQNASLSIRKGERIGVVGNTGGGKSTFLDVLMGLLKPESGSILVDDIPLVMENISSWQKNIAHVPQNIFLSDSSIGENVAFGRTKPDIDANRMKNAVDEAQLRDFIESLPQGYDTRVGERGIRLSGGQRQRIGIARALYKRSSVLVLDEATSALDDATENAVMATINALDRGLTVIMVSHRLTTLSGCDRIVEVRAGEIIEHGSYQNFRRSKRL